AAAAAGDVVLHEPRVEAHGGADVVAPALEEVAPVVPAHDGREQEGARDVEALHGHAPRRRRVPLARHAVAPNAALEAVAPRAAAPSDAASAALTPRSPRAARPAAPASGRRRARRRRGGPRAPRPCWPGARR